MKVRIVIEAWIPDRPTVDAVGRATRAATIACGEIAQTGGVVHSIVVEQDDT